MEDKQTKQDEKKVLLDTEISDVFVVQSSRKRAYVEQFKHKGVNFTQKKLGTFLGFFIVRDASSSSANIVNFLTAEVKKEYFAFPKRGIAESFETALHRVNRALAEVANVGNVEWLGTIDGAVCAIDDTTMYFSVTGEAAVLLMRGDNVMDISEGIASEEAKQHPLKTFIDISNGQLMAGDKIIITSPELLDLVPLDELQRNALRLGRDNFVQFINTVLTNECKMAVTTVVDVNEKTMSVANTSGNVKQKMGEERLEDMNIPNNVFSAQVFESEGIDRESLNKSGQVVEVEEEADFNDESEGEYVDERTGHIYLQGEEGEDDANPFWLSIKDFFKDTTRSIKEGTKKKFKRSKRKIKSLMESRKEEQEQLESDEFNVTLDSASASKPNTSNRQIDKNYEIAKLKEEIIINDSGYKESKLDDEKKIGSISDSKQKEEKPSIKIKVSEDKSLEDDKFKRDLPKIERKKKRDLIKKSYAKKSVKSDDELRFEDEGISVVDRVLDFLEDIIDFVTGFFVTLYKNSLKFFSKLFSAKKNASKKVEKVEKIKPLKSTEKISEKIKVQKTNIFKKENSFLKFFSNVKNYWGNVNGKNKVIGLTVLALVLAVPLFFMGKKNKSLVNNELAANAIASNDSGTNNSNEANVQNEDKPNEANESSDNANKDEENKNEDDNKIEGNIKDPEEIYKGTDLVYVDKMATFNIAVTKDSVVVLDDENIKYNLPADAGVVKFATAMDDLKLVFLLTDKNKLFSFSPVDKKFDSQTLNVSVSKVKAIDTYMTYIYVVTDEGIKRHARKEGGFDEGSNWIDDDYKIKGVVDTTINENIYVVKNGEVNALFNHKEKEFELAEKQKADLVYVKGTENLWVLNKGEGTIYKFNRFSGRLVDEFVHNDIKTATSFAVNEKSNSAMVSTAKGVFQFNLKKK